MKAKHSSVWLTCFIALCMMFVAAFSLGVMSACDSPEDAKPCPDGEHNFVLESSTDATCTQAGEIVYRCSVCKQEKREEIKMLDHRYGDPKIITYANLEGGAGQTEAVCELCHVATKKVPYAIENKADSGADVIVLNVSGTEYFISAAYGAEGVTFSVRRSDDFGAEEVSLLLSPRGAVELENGTAYKVSFGREDVISCGVYNGSDYSATAAHSDGLTLHREGDTVTLLVPYAFLGTSDRTLAFYPSVKAGGTEKGYRANNAFVTPKYAETWLNLTDSNRMWYHDYDRTIANWARPSFKDHDNMFVGVIKERTVEEAIVAIGISEEKGAMGFDLHMNYLNDAGLLTSENIARIVRSTHLPVLALFYDGSKIQEVRRDGLELAVRAGVAACDLQGFMFHSGSTQTTQTEENRSYYEALGYGMSFVDVKPSETVCDPAEVALQKEFIDKIHGIGGEVLISAHTGKRLSAQQAIDYAEFMAKTRGVDVIKIVGVGNSALDVLECVEACRYLRDDEEMGDTKFSFHVSGDGSAGCAAVDISRILAPAFYGSYVAFCRAELTEGQDRTQLDLDWAPKALEAANDAAPDISVLDAIARLRELFQGSMPQQLAGMIETYEQSSTVAYFGYGKATEMSDRWTISDENWHMQLRDTQGTNNFVMRCFAYDVQREAKDIWYSAEITADMTPFQSATRTPRVGIYVGGKNDMLAFVYNTYTKSLELCDLGTRKDFGYDEGWEKDALSDTGLITGKTYSVDLAAKGVIRLGLHKTAEKLTLYFAEGSDGAWTQIAEFDAETLGTKFGAMDAVCPAGALAEVYMGSKSVGKVNTIDWTNVSYIPLDLA